MFNYKIQEKNEFKIKKFLDLKGFNYIIKQKIYLRLENIQKLHENFKNCIAFLNYHH